MTEFNTNKRYHLIIIPFRAFQLLTMEEHTVKCLANIHRHLTDDGIFIINAYKPYMFLDESWVQPEKEDWTVVDTNTGITIKRTHIKKRIDLLNQINYPELYYYVTHPDGKQEIFTEKLAMKYYYEHQLKELLISSGFKIISEFGYYDERRIIEGNELIFGCVK
jgi:hypothetical protein